jgi:REP element-mobilizing transposase RayT
MDQLESLSHSVSECKYHVAFIPKCRRRSLYEGLRCPVDARPQLNQRVTPLDM